MICRKCPGCGIVRFSANTLDWICEMCKAVVTDEHDQSLE